MSDSNFSYWHSATFNNDGTKLLFSDEWGGGGGPKCRATDPKEWGADAIFTIVDGKLHFQSYYKLPAAQTDKENCVAHNGSMIPIPGRDVMVQSWYQGGISVFDWTDPTHPREIGFFDRGPMDSTQMVGAGSWSAYWYNGVIVSSEIARGMDIFALQPSGFISQNEIDAAKTVHFDEFNTQGQPHFVWPATFALARAYVDQLERSQGLAADADCGGASGADQGRARFGSGARERIGPPRDGVGWQRRRILRRRQGPHAGWCGPEPGRGPLSDRPVGRYTTAPSRQSRWGRCVFQRLGYASVMSALTSPKGTASFTKAKVPRSRISRAARIMAPRAARFSADPTLIRRTPSAANSATEKGAPWRPARTLTGLVTAPHRRPDVLGFGEPGRVEHIRPGLFEGLQPADGVVQSRDGHEGNSRRGPPARMGTASAWAASAAAATRSTACWKS